VFKAVKFPAGVTNLDTSLSDVDGNAFSHFLKGKVQKEETE
jgi:hypothetical protein